MPGYVAMHEPAARVVGLESDDNEAASGQKHYVSSGRVVKREIEPAGVVLLIFLLLQKSEIVAVEMNLKTCRVRFPSKDVMKKADIPGEPS